VLRLVRYLSRLFFSEALALAGVVVTLLYLVQCLRILDLISVKGQGVLTLFLQALLIVPLIGAIFLYICVGIGLARALTALQASGELHIIHSSRRLPGLFGALALYGTVSALVVLSLSHFASPAALRHYDEWQANIAADLVARALAPHRFVEAVPGVTVLIGSRTGEGHITDFFADDNRDPNSRRTYSARSAIVGRDAGGYVLQMEDGAIEYMTADRRYSEIRFSHYDLSVGSLTQEHQLSENATSWVLVQRALAEGWSDKIIRTLVERSGEGLRVIGMCLLIIGIAGFPSGRRRRFAIPLEFAVLVIAFADRGLTTYAPEWMGLARPAAGALGMIAVGILLVGYRLWSPHLRLPRGRAFSQARPA
jgi:lipopolysaccharide export system permease protein